MAEKMYEVIAEKLTGKHKVYNKGAVIPASEIMGDLEVLLKGQKDKKNKRGQELPNIDPVLKVAGKSDTAKKGK